VSSPVETATRRLAASQVDTEHPTTPDTWDDAATTSYSYDPAGNVTSMAGTTAGVADQAECFTYDHLRRLTQAWTETTPTCTTPQRTGADPYRQAFTYDPTGNRLTATTWSATGSTTATSTYPTPGSPQPHTVTAVDHTGETTGTDTYAYTTGGHTQTRTVDGVTQTLTWDAEGRLATTSEPGLDTTNIYDADGSRLIRRDTTGSTLYLGHTELRRTASNGQVDGTRHYQHAGATIAVRTVTGLTWLIPDHHGTNQITIDPTNLDLTRRRTLPFGDTRGTPPTAWPDDKGFVGGTQDPTGLTHIGARHYDPTLGRFISVDPIMDPADPQQMHGYAYANNNPTTWSDPTGLRVCADNDCGQGATPKPGGGYNEPTGKPSCHPNCNPNSTKQPTTGGAPKPPTKGGNGSGSQDYACGKYGACGGEAKPEACGSWNGGCLADSPDPDVAGVQHVAFLEMTGIADAMRCYQGQWQGCAWLATILIPGGLIAKAAVKTPIAAARATKATRTARAANIACSFSGDTKVLMADGTTKPIENIEVGDKVAATDPETGEEGHRKVTHLWIHDDQLVNLTVASGDLTTTEDHPFWNHTDQQWQRADNLDPGDHLLTATGETLPATGIDWATTQHDTAYNLTVADIHTYYVLAGNTPVLVHNTCPLGAGDVPRKVVNSNMGHIDLERAQRAGFDTVQSAQSAVRELGVSIKSDGFPRGTIPDTSRSDRVLVPLGKNGYGVYQILPNGNAVFKTILTQRD